MPKKNNKSSWGGGRGRPNNSEKDHYFSHDDRSGRSNDGQIKYNNSNKFSKPRVSFKRQNKSDFSKKNHLILKQQLDDDVSMSGSNNNSRHIVSRGRGGGRGFSRGRNSPLPHGNVRDGRPRICPPGDSGWHKITIPHGQKYTKDFVLGNLLSLIAPSTFTPVMYKVIGMNAEFYIEDQRVATKLVDCDRRITTAEGYKMQVRVRPGAPPIEINADLKERLTQAMAKRYVLETNALDLSKFSQDPDLAGEYWCPLYRPNMLQAVLEIVHEHIPNLGALNLDANKMYSVEKLGALASKFDKLKILYLGDNRIKELNHLNTLRDLQVEELRLAGNPVCMKYRNRQEDYVNDIRKIFPKILKLDGNVLPPPIRFDLEDDKLKLPPPQKMFIADENFKAKEMAGQFLQQYFTVLDSETRQDLLNAYHEHAFMSLTTQNINPNSGKFGQYLYESRNLLKVSDAGRRKKLLKQGRLPIVSFISEMPRTKHDLNSFTMDLSLITEGMMLITVSGLFKEVRTGNSKEREQIRFFQRIFVIVPEGNGFCISNERLHINNPSSEQEKKFSDIASAPQPTPGPSTVPAATGTPVPLSEEVKQQMTMTLSQQTNMNIEWSLRCLGEVQWDFERARIAFQEAFAQGKIPPDAFKK